MRRNSFQLTINELSDLRPSSAVLYAPVHLHAFELYSIRAFAAGF
jgi:hypothetical protein